MEYSLGEDRSYVFAVTSTSLAAYELPKRARIESVARDLYKLVTAPDDSGKTHSRAEAKRKTGLNQALATLSRMVLGPVAAQIKGKRLLGVSDGALQYIAFAMLPDLAESSADNASGAPLIAGHEIINLPSASVLAVLPQQNFGRHEAPKNAAGLAHTGFDKRDERVIRKTRAGTLRRQ